MEATCTLTATRIASGVWEGVVEAPAGTTPEIEASHQDEILPGISLTPVEGGPGRWALRVPIPAAILADGVQTVLITEKPGGAHLGSFSIVTGEPLETDIRAEIDLLRAELDMLKRAFRRHCLETA